MTQTPAPALTTTAKLLFAGVSLIVVSFALPFLGWGMPRLFFDHEYGGLAVIVGSAALGMLGIILGALLLVGTAVAGGAKALQAKADNSHTAHKGSLQEA